MAAKRYEQADQAAWIGIVGNLSLALLKGAAGWFSGSKALLADAVHSASDAAGSVAALVGLRASRRPTGDSRPFAHGQDEAIAAILVSVLLLVAGFEIGLAALRTIYYGTASAPKSYSLIVIVLAMIVKECMFRFTYRNCSKFAGYSLVTNAWEHRSDLYASLAAFAGAGGAIMGKMLALPQFYYLDQVVGVFISLLVLRMAYRLITKAIYRTMDHDLHRDDAEELLLAVQRVKGVVAVDELRAREHGHYVIVELKICVNPKISVLEGNEIAKSVRFHLMKRFIHISDVFIHVHPYDSAYPYKISVDSGQDDIPTLLH